jgi:acyl-CoA thioesterase FadM
MSRLYSAIKRLAPRGDRAAIGSVVGYAGGGRYRVHLAGTEYEVPAAGDAQAWDGQSVAVLVSAETGKPIAMLGPVRQPGGA